MSPCSMMKKVVKAIVRDEEKRRRGFFKCHKLEYHMGSSESRSSFTAGAESIVEFSLIQPNTK